MKTSPWQYHRVSVLGGMAIGAGLMYLLDSDLGTARRMRLCSQAVLGLRKLAAMAAGKARNLRSQARRVVAPISIVARKPVPDWVLAERARLEISRTLAHPDAIQVTARDGCLTLWGPVLAGEPEKLRERLVHIPGLRKLELQLTTREESAARVA